MSNRLFHQGVRIDQFERQFTAYSMVFCGRQELDEGGKILLPQSALDELARLSIVWPIMFKISNPNKPNLYTHCGVLEFSAPEGQAFIPFWIQEKLQVKPGTIVTIQTVSLPKGSFVKIRPQLKAFIEISDPKIVLEQKLRNFSCLTKGDTIIIKHVKEFAIDIMEVSSEGNPNCDSISIVETDVKVEFERPLDMPPSPVNPPKEDMFDFAQPTKKQQQGASSSDQKKDAQQAQAAPTTPSFAAFSGSGRRLDGKGTPSSAVTPVQQQQKFFDQQQQQQQQKPVNQQQQQKPVDGIVWGSGSKKVATETPKPAPTTPKAQQDKKFEPFSGSGRKLK